MIVIPIIAINKNLGLPEGRRKSSRALVALDEAAICGCARKVVARTLESSSAEERTDVGVIQEKIRQDLKRFLNKETSRRPLIVPVILEV
jgi:ribonuclease J